MRLLLGTVVDLLLVLSYTDSRVKARMCQKDTLQSYFKSIDDLPKELLHKALKSVKHLTVDPSVLTLLAEAGTIRQLVLWLKDGTRNYRLDDAMQLEVMTALIHLCKFNKQRQEMAAENGIVPLLRK